MDLHHFGLLAFRQRLNYHLGWSRLVFSDKNADRCSYDVVKRCNTMDIEVQRYFLVAHRASM